MVFLLRMAREVCLLLLMSSRSSLAAAAMSFAFDMPRDTDTSRPEPSDLRAAKHTAYDEIMGDTVI